MAKYVDIVVGRYYDGVDETVDGYVAKKLYAIYNAAATVDYISLMRAGRQLVAVICWQDA